MTPALILTFRLFAGAAVLAPRRDGVKKRLPRRRRATIVRHMEVLQLAVPPLELAREIAMAREVLDNIKGLEALLEDQDRILVLAYREVYMRRLRLLDDEFIMMA